MAYPDERRVTVDELKSISGIDDVEIIQRGDEEKDEGGRPLIGVAVARFGRITKSISNRHINPDDGLREIARAAREESGKKAKDNADDDAAPTPELVKTKDNTPPSQQDIEAQNASLQATLDDPTTAKVFSAPIDGQNSKGVSPPDSNSRTSDTTKSK